MRVADISNLVFLVVLLTASNVLATSYPTEAVELTDSNFEHDTQAASGQTTGVWAVLFTDSTLKRHERAVQVLQELANDEDKELIYAQVDVAHNVKLARRFGNVIFPPCIVLFRNRQMYLFDQSFERADIIQQIRDFVTSGFALADPLDVPENRDRKLNLEAFETSTKMDYKTIAVAILMILGGLIFQTWAVMNKDKFRPERGTPEAAAAATAANKPGDEQQKQQQQEPAVGATAEKAGKRQQQQAPAAAAGPASPSGDRRGSAKGAKKGKASS
ncbi:hypothetical protein Vretimale_1060 [Volvox reticuliferus]|uniref:Thioredoxin domain-containing protein n=1 Tax=Volvox reticuliferus TaxID=1737510 RepID=A0A8J4FYZ8_9CHLO|nr:hypothetical protein Vretifemale_10372 [Volvox reticuliferus]GIL94954.1 hypothetical protein Vretimale_1060 [Volvox reticuliferus]